MAAWPLIFSLVRNIPSKAQSDKLADSVHKGLYFISTKFALVYREVISIMSGSTIRGSTPCVINLGEVI